MTTSLIHRSCGTRSDPLEHRAKTERRIAAFVASGLDDYRIRARTVIRGVYLRNERDYAKRIRALLD
jgi:hypothetical protein